MMGSWYLEEKRTEGTKIPADFAHSCPTFESTLLEKHLNFDDRLTMPLV